MYKYKNTSESKLVIVGVGEVDAGVEFHCPREINNPNLELSGVTQEETNQVSGTAVTNTDNVVTEAVLADNGEGVI